MNVKQTKGEIFMETLFHYTNIEALALILKNQTIRLNSLDKMDDLEENMTKDLYNAGMFTYVSCWTSDKRENIALWKQYTNHDTGVRIELPRNPFEKYDALELIKNERFRKILSENPDIRTIFRLDKMLDSNYYTQDITGENILYEMEYTENEDEIIPQISSYSALDKMTNINFKKLGKYKREAWKFQKEWRYIIQFYPGNVLSVYKDNGMTLANAMRDFMDGKVQQPFPYFDLKIDEHAFKKMKIVLSPTITAGNEILIRNAIERYNPEAEIFESAFKGKIR